jgi:LSD1 subclass zinc finger protein
MSESITCSNCHAQLHPTGKASRVRCSYCDADNLIDPAVLAAIAARGPVAPPEELEKVKQALQNVLHDAEALLHVLEKKLHHALPGQVQTESSGGLFSKKVHKVTAQVGDHQYVVELGPARNLVAQRAHHVRGISLKRQELSISELVNALAAELYELSQEKQPEAMVRFIAG